MIIKQNIAPFILSKTETNIDESDINYVFKSIYITIILNIQILFGKGSCWIIDSVTYHSINIPK